MSFEQKSKPLRPRVDPTALGDVDPTLYPDPKDATNKIRGRSDVMEFIFGDMDQEFLYVKLFYFFFYSAFGSLFPLMGVYFKQMGMNAMQCGLLIGCRPFVEFLAAPFWGSYADRWKKGKTLLLVSLSCWIIFTLPIGYLQPRASNCLVPTGDGSTGEYKLELTKKDLDGGIQMATNASEKEDYIVNVTKSEEPGKSPYKLMSVFKNDFLVSPLFSPVVYKIEDIQNSFFLMLLLVMIGEFFSAPAITLADSAVINLLGDDADRYGHQRMFGSLGWGLSMFFLGIALDHSTAFSDHPCSKPDEREKNYNICFFAFSVLMGGALATASQIRFRYEEAPKEGEKEPFQTNDDDALEQEVARQLNLPSLATNSARKTTIPSINTGDQPLNVGKTRIFAQTTREIPEWVTVLRHFANVKCGAFLFVAWFMGFGIGLIFTFLFWHLQEFGGTPTLFGFASVINHISEIFAYFFSFRLIRHFGHVKVLCLGLGGNFFRFIYVSLLTNPWWVLPFELMQGITHAAVWAACCSYIAHNTPPHLRNSAQGVLQGVHHGLGRGCGAVIGGFFVTHYGSTATFRRYGILCAVVLAVFIFINFYRKDVGGFVSDLPATEDPHQVAEESVHLAPHGVPSNPIPRVLSSNRLYDSSDNESQSYGTTGMATGPNRGAIKNPFLSDNFDGRNRDNNGRVNKPVTTNIFAQQPENNAQSYNF